MSFYVRIFLGTLLPLALYTCFAFYCISAVLRDRCWFCMTATVINEHYYYYHYYLLFNNFQYHSQISGTGKVGSVVIFNILESFYRAAWNAVAV